MPATAVNTTSRIPAKRDISPAAFQRGLLGLFIAGLITRMGYLLEHARSPSFGVLTLDQKYYDGVARLLLSGADLRPLHGFKPLLYPMFVAVFYKLGGDRGIDLTILAQHLLGVLTGLLVALLGERVFRHRLGGLAGGALYLLAPLPLCFEGELLIESSYVFLICAGLLLVLHAAEAPPEKAALPWFLCGALTALTAQERPNILVFMAVYPLLAAGRWLFERQGAAFLPLLALAGAVAMGIPWGFVNKKQSGHFQIIPTTGGVNLYLGNRRGADGVSLALDRRVNYDDRYEDPVEVWAREGYEAAHQNSGSDPAAISRYWTGRALDEIKADPVAWLRLMAKKCCLTFWNGEAPILKSFTFLQSEFLWLRLLPVRWVVLLALAPVGIWAAFQWGNRDALFIVGFYALIYSAANLAFFIFDRYRYPVWPAMAVIAGGGLVASIDAVLSSRWRQVMWIGVSAAVMAAISLPNWSGVKLRSFALDYRLRSIAWYEKQRFPEALSDIDHSLELDPTDPPSLVQRGNILLAMGRFEDARQDYERTLKFIPGDASVWNNYGGALDGLGRTQDALDVYRRAIACQPPSESAYFGLTFDLLQTGRLDEAAAVLDQFDKVEQGPNPIALALRSVVARVRGQTAQADALEQRARAIDPETTAWAIDHARNKGQK